MGPARTYAVLSRSRLAWTPTMLNGWGLNFPPFGVYLLGPMCTRGKQCALRAHNGNLHVILNNQHKYCQTRFIYPFASQWARSVPVGLRQYPTGTLRARWEVVPEFLRSGLVAAKESSKIIQK